MCSSTASMASWPSVTRIRPTGGNTSGSECQSSHFAIQSTTSSSGAECHRAGEHREDFRRELQLEPGRPIILFASKLQARKRCGDLLEAFLKLSSTPMDGPRPYLLIIGDGEKRAELEQRARSATPGDIRFLGFQNQTALPAFYDLCDVFVLASVHEPWGLVINEVMNAARPVIVSTDVGCQKDLVEDGVNGYVVEPGSYHELAAGLKQILADPAATRKMGLKSLEKIESYSFEQNVAGLSASAACRVQSRRRRLRLRTAY